MSRVNRHNILKFIENSTKISDMEKKDKNVYHRRIGLKGMNGPYIDIKHAPKQFLGTSTIEVIYNGDTIFNPSKDDLETIQEAIEVREKVLKDNQVEKKKEEFLKIVEDI